MKRVISIASMLFVFNVVSAQMTSKCVSDALKMVWDFRKVKPYVSDDIVNQDGVRTVCSSFRLLDIADQKNKPSCRMGFVGTNLGETRVLLNVFLIRNNQSLSIDNFSPVLIRLGNDSILNTQVVYSYEYSPTYTVGPLSGFYTYRTNVALLLSNDELQMIFDNGIKKLRFEVNRDRLDLDMKKDNISSFLKETYQLVSSSMSKQKSFDDDF